MTVLIVASDWKGRSMLDYTKFRWAMARQSFSSLAPREPTVWDKIEISYAEAAVPEMKPDL